MNDYSDRPAARRRREVRPENTRGGLKGVAAMITLLALAAGGAALSVL